MHVKKVVDLVTGNLYKLSLHFSDFSMNLYQFYNFAVFENKNKRKRDLASRPLERFGRLQIGHWLENRGGGEHGWPESGVGAHRRCGRSGGEAPRRREEPVDSLGWSWDGRWWRCHGAAAPAEGARGAGSAPAREERRGPAGEDQWEVGNRFRGLPRVEDGGRRGLHGGLGGGGGYGGQRGFLGAV